MKNAIIVGASSGIGYELAKLLLEKGWQVGAAARRIDRFDELKSAFSDQLAVAKIDVLSETAGEGLLALIADMGGVDLYLHVAGVGWNNPELDIERELTTVETNATGFVRMVGTAFRYMSTHGGGHIAAITSIAGTKGLGPAPAYSSTKALQSTYIQSLEQLALSKKLKVTFTDVQPGFVDTDLLAGDHYPLLMKKEKTAKQALKAILAHKHVAVIDFRYRVLTAFWRRVPRFIWRHVNLLVS